MTLLINLIAMFRQIEEIRESLLNYLEARIELLQIEVRERIESVVLTALYFFIGAFLVFITLLFALILLSVGLNIWLDSRYAGYVIILSLFLILSLVWFLFRLQWLTALRSLLTRMAHKKESVDP